jgi:hypothetical protein
MAEKKTVNGTNRSRFPSCLPSKIELIWFLKRRKKTSEPMLTADIIIMASERRLTASSSFLGSITARSYLPAAIVLIIPVIARKDAKIPISAVVKRRDKIGAISKGTA